MGRAVMKKITWKLNLTLMIFILARKFFYIREKIFLYLQENFDLDWFGNKALFKNVLCAFFISLCSYGSFLWLKNC